MPGVIPRVRRAADVRRFRNYSSNEGILRAELEALEWQATARSAPRDAFPEGMSGDMVIALALVVSLATRPSTKLTVWGGEGVGLPKPSPFEEHVKRRGSWFPGD